MPIHRSGTADLAVMASAEDIRCRRNAAQVGTAVVQLLDLITCYWRGFHDFTLPYLGLAALGQPATTAVIEGSFYIFKRLSVY